MVDIEQQAGALKDKDEDAKHILKLIHSYGLKVNPERDAELYFNVSFDSTWTTATFSWRFPRPS